MSELRFFRPVRDFVDGLVHPSAQRDVLTAARHRAFIAPRLLGSLLILSVLPAYLLVRGTPSSLEVTVFAWLILPILAAYFLSRTGRYEDAHILSSLSLTSVVTAVAMGTGGAASFAAVWLVLVPLEAALSASRRVVAVASTAALAAAASLVGAQMSDLLPPAATIAASPAALAAFGIVSAVLYATWLAIGAESLTRASFQLLQAQEDRYLLLARNISDVIVRHGRQGGVTFLSPSAESLFRARACDLRNHGLFERVHVADRPAYLTALSRAAAGEPRSAEFRVRRDSGTPEGIEHVWVEMRCRPLDDARGKDRDVVSVMRDISERKSQERALDLAQEESKRADTAKTRFVATMSHELRTPLSAIIGFSEMLANETQMRVDAGRRNEYARLINESGHHLLAVINGILDMSKMEAGDFEIAPESFSPREVIAGCGEMLALKASDSGIALSVDLPTDLPDIVADKRALRQIMLNLVANAVKFTDRGGRVSVTAAVECSRLAIAVEDTGIGISEADLARVGAPFFQARSSYDRRHDGTGLGLSIVKGLVELHGGEIDMHSRVGQGTRVTVRLPFDCGQKGATIAHPDFGQNRRRAFTDDMIAVKKSA